MAWPELAPLYGTWVGEGTEGGLGAAAGRGEFEFRPELDERVVVRTNRAEYPESGGRPASTHRDLMIVFRGASGAPRATYWDTEGHVIDYEVRPLPAPDVVEFRTDPRAPGTAYRLTYRADGPDRLTGRFEVRSGPTEPFRSYLVWSARRKTGAPSG